MAGIVVIGGGIAGQSVCERVRERDADVPITLVCKEGCAPYDRVALSHLLAGETTSDQLQLRPRAWYDDTCIALRHTCVDAVDLEHGLCSLSDGGTLVFDRVVLCTGSEPLMPPIAGIELPGVVAFRDPADCAEITERARRADHAVV